MKYPISRARIRGLMYIAAIIAIDQWTKIFFFQEAHKQAVPIKMLPFFNIDIVFNRGISFGVFSGMPAWMPHLLTFATSLIVLFLAFWLMRAREQTVILSLSVIIGGALGNIIDRIHYGFVIDFLDFHIENYHWPAFNIADSAVFIGVVILVLMSIVSPDSDLSKE